MEKQLVTLACTHHIHELIPATVFESLIEPSKSGPQIKVFQRFASSWCFINSSSFESGTIQAHIERTQRTSAVQSSHHQCLFADVVGL